MKIYLLKDPKLYCDYARISNSGTWSKGTLCEECTQHTQKLMEPLVIAWAPDSDNIGDFAWCYYTCVVTDKVKAFLLSRGLGVDFGKVVFQRCTAKVKKRKIVPFPYTGPPLHWLRVYQRVKLNESKSNVQLETDCKKCGQKDYTFRWEGIFIDSVMWNGEKIFRIEQFGQSAATFVTEEAKELIENQGFTNVAFSEAGDIG